MTTVAVSAVFKNSGAFAAATATAVAARETPKKERTYRGGDVFKPDLDLAHETSLFQPPRR